MASSEKQVPTISNLTAITDFKAGVVRSIKQYNEGEVETFDNVDDFLADLHSSE
jgi:hypothetical protein